jgi:hypothetical protein
MLQPTIYIPSGAGWPRRDDSSPMRRSFAEMEAILILTTILQRYRLELVSDRPVIPAPSVTLRPGGGVRVRMRRRD